MSGASTTRWSLVLAARGANAASRDALGQLCENYRPVILAFFRRHDEGQQAEDRTQAFLLHFLESGLHARADADKGSFRAFLFTAVRNHWHESLRNEATRKRQRGSEAGEDALLELPADEPGPERQFDRDWALNVFARAQASLREEAGKAGKGALFEAVRGFLLEAPESSDYKRVGEALTMPANTVAVAVKRLRERLRSLVQQELADTLPPGADLAAELEWLRRALRPG
jgi:RNA polymerase sigma factor (sigma-70 family)